MILNKEFDKKFDTIFNLLKDLSPNYYIKSSNMVGQGLSLNYGGYFKSTSFGEAISKELKTIIYHLKKEINLQKITDDFISMISAELNKTIESFIIVEVRKVKYHFQQNTRIYSLFEPGHKEYTIDTIPDPFLTELVNFSQTKYNLILNFIDALQQLKSPIISETQNKLVLGLSVPEIALLFRLLDEDKLLIYNYKTDLYRFILNTFSTTKKVDISENKIKYFFKNPEVNSIKKINALLTRLLVQLGKMNHPPQAD